MGRNSRNGTRGGRVNWQHFAASTGKRLAAQYFITDANAQFTFSANMLFQWYDKTLRQWYLAQGRTVGLGFHLRWMDAAVEIPDFIFSECRE
ncbi:hypothetical protein EC12741_2222 [Escherichia coli 1.2741]|nr:hypothetical protein ECSTEC7V_1987 [Escherichia coli STEC_7v]EIG82486.1 hypothetical protein EC12741_2222 [Escherichia coli 1.2741]BDI36475.1 hypothetical protein EsCdI10290_02184 [Escherichia sp. 10290]BDI46291.1 hypothetical protein EsCd1HHP049_02035 [Escherichia sp. HH154_1D]